MPSLQPTTLEALRVQLPATATACVDVIVAEVPGYHRAFDARLRRNIEQAVQQALSTFIEVQGGTESATWAATLEGARTLGAGEAASGRSTDALLAAYRVGARVAWQSFSAQALDCSEQAPAIAELAAQTFAFIDELSAESLTGHTDALSRRTRELARRRDQLAAALAAGEHRTALERLAEGARWVPPSTLTALVVDGEASTTLQRVVGEDALWLPVTTGSAVALIGDLSALGRAAALSSHVDERVCLGPAMPWLEAADSIRHAHRLLHLFPTTTRLDSERHLPELLIDADTKLAARLADRALTPLRDLSDPKQDVLRETLLSWLLHQGRRDDVATALHVHPQTVRYRMNQIRDRYGDALTDPQRVLELLLGLVAADLNHQGSH